jgi:L-ascorbate metabolism protein UlaG (beta-lactamase superfamily)
MRIQYLGHACVLVVAGDRRLLIDPFIRPNPWAAAIRPEELEVTDVLITHGHEDHLADALEFAVRPGVRTIACYEVAEWLGAQGAQHPVGMNIGGTLSWEGGRLRMVPALHSSTLPDGKPGGVAAGYLIESEGIRLYHAGDTALSAEMGLIGDLWPPDVALLPVGDHFTMGPEDALHAARLLHCTRAFALHFDTFPPISLSDERKRAAEAAFRADGRSLTFWDIGASYPLD